MIRLLCQIVGHERVIGFADDLAVILPSLEDLPRIRDAFQAFEKASGLRLRLSKCRLLPLRPYEGSYDLL